MVNSWLKCDKIMMNLIKYIYHLKRNLVKRFIMVTCKKIICVLNICYEFVQRFYQMLTFKLLLGLLQSINFCMRKSHFLIDTPFDVAEHFIPFKITFKTNK